VKKTDRYKNKWKFDADLNLIDEKLNYVLLFISWSQLQSWLSSESFEGEAGTIEVGKGELSLFQARGAEILKNNCGIKSEWNNPKIWRKLN
jgi:hypothetical protein